MNKARLVCFVALISLLPGLACAQKKSIPQFEGFPIYPPEKISQIKRSGEEISARLSIRGKDWVISELGKTRGMNFGETMRETMHAADAVSSKEFKEAEDYIKTKASRLGWKLIDEDTYRDGGSRKCLFARKDKKIKIMNVHLWSSGIVCSADGCSVDEDWGFIDYNYKESDRPAEYKGFPLLLGTASVQECKKNDTEEGVLLGCPRNENYFMEGWKKFPELYGWKLRSSPNISDHEAIYEKEGKIVKADEQGNFVFYSQAAAPKILELYPQNVYRKEVAYKGCLISQGKYIRPPYVVEFKDNKIFVNEALFDPCAGYEPRQALQWFQIHVDTLTRGIEIGESGAGSISRVPMSEKEIKDFIMQIDSIVKSQGPDSKKVESLRKLELLQSNPEDSLLLILKNWDGIEPGLDDKARLQKVQDEEALRQARARPGMQQRELQDAFYRLKGAKEHVGFLMSLPTPPSEELARAQQELQLSQAKLKQLQDQLTPEENQLAMAEIKFDQAKMKHDDLLLKITGLQENGIKRDQERVVKALAQLKLSKDSVEAKSDLASAQKFLQWSQEALEESKKSLPLAQEQLRQAETEVQRARKAAETVIEKKQQAKI